MNKRELKRLSRADLLEMLIIKSRENEQLRAELEEARAQAAQRPVEPAEPAAVPDEQLGLALQALKLAAERCLEDMRARNAGEEKMSGEDAAE